MLWQCCNRLIIEFKRLKILHFPGWALKEKPPYVCSAHVSFLQSLCLKVHPVTECSNPCPILSRLPSLKKEKRAMNSISYVSVTDRSPRSSCFRWRLGLLLLLL